MRNVTVAATQMACTWDREETLERAAGLVEEAAQKGANIVLLQELFETPYFCQQERTEYLKLATTVEENPAIAYFQKMAKQLLKSLYIICMIHLNWTALIFTGELI